MEDKERQRRGRTGLLSLISFKYFASLCQRASYSFSQGQREASLLQEWTHLDSPVCLLFGCRQVGYSLSFSGAGPLI